MKAISRALMYQISVLGETYFHPTQFGFVRGRSAQGALCTLEGQLFSMEHHTELSAIFMDLPTAFPKLSRSW
eukprot:6056220-Prorocentrum_lima.AAC.1